MFDVSLPALGFRASKVTAVRAVKSGPIVPANFAAPAAPAKIITLEDLKARLAASGIGAFSA